MLRCSWRYDSRRVRGGLLTKQLYNVRPTSTTESNQRAPAFRHSLLTLALGNTRHRYFDRAKRSVHAAPLAGLKADGADLNPHGSVRSLGASALVKAGRAVPGATVPSPALAASSAFGALEMVVAHHFGPDG